ncbi:hypothetical protein BDN72DRAFT_840260 [Pluteus cervinus]|uniref:Uncharacterized protein n=1 Tax=Pluteus cervinus TaxID=181527 RepID=A0ACD3AV94_9AGAR|nr:hypothetical protein BDN72DRAFT_840260 [Pluteus cervinus]
MALLTFVNAIPLNARDVVSPPITVPNAQTIWAVGTQQTVTWDTSNIPPDSQLTQPNGKIVLGWLSDDSENLQIDTPLAQGFPLRAGSAQITIPNVPPRNNYIVVLFGDSGNASPEFTIVAAGSSTPPAPASPSPSTLITDPPTAPLTTSSSADSPQPSVEDGAHVPPVQNAAGPSSSSPVSSSSSSTSPSGSAAATTPSPNAALSSKHLGLSTIFMAALTGLALVLNL